ncbi:hypothetical protein BC_3145 [Bacillus cereus ATCC 14579]|uniref:Uncharacterized protein n=2 Tax=Bacillus cereus group TaxID=86661 RepID=Q81BL0_BACCR|nr:hypothetical protein BC_3145 [Bacillus cereus ATCC 14579]OOR40902.1 hypothetical protein BW896_26870 [Bacillus cereus]OTZ32435.1 hypothetical protein BK761_15710 [Bacillus thuringiensis serovar darmstadiensis]
MFSITKSITKPKVDFLFYKEIGSFVYVLRYKSFLIFSGMSFLKSMQQSLYSKSILSGNNQKTYITI